MLVTINSSVNILIYCTFGKKFRTVFMQIFFGKQPPYVLSSTSVLRTHRASEPQGNGQEIANTETVQLAASMKSSPQSNTSRKYSYNLQNDQNQRYVISNSVQGNAMQFQSILQIRIEPIFARRMNVVASFNLLK